MLSRCRHLRIPSYICPNCRCLRRNSIRTRSSSCCTFDKCLVKCFSSCFQTSKSKEGLLRSQSYKPFRTECRKANNRYTFSGRISSRRTSYRIHRSILKSRCSRWTQGKCHTFLSLQQHCCRLSRFQNHTTNCCSVQNRKFLGRCHKLCHHGTYTRGCSNHCSKCDIRTQECPLACKRSLFHFCATKSPSRRNCRPSGSRQDQVCHPRE